VIPLSVLELFLVASDNTPTRAIHDALALARRADELGYTRYWIAEHHNMPSIASSAPEVMIGHVAGLTKRIRVGSGGIMIPNHTPLRVVEIFRTLEALYPGRIDLGIGRAPGTDPVTSAALRHASRESIERIAELVAFAEDDFPEGHPFAGIQAMPADAPLPPIWMLGSTSAGARIAAELGVGFSFAGHFSMAEADEALATYRKLFRPSATLAEPRVMMAVGVICGSTQKRAEQLATCIKVAVARLASGEKKPFPTVEEAERFEFRPGDAAAINRFSEGAVVGDEARVKAGLDALVKRTGADELMIATMVPDPAERLASYEAIARVWGLEPTK
jgi:luciferase family oxidoreductase group 1